MRNLVWSAIVLGLTSTAAMAQGPAQDPRLSTATVSPAAMPALTASATPSGDQAPAAQDPSAKQDSATMDFFRKIEISGFVDTYYTYNFNRPSQPCATVGGVAVSNCLYNFNVAHNSLSINLAEVALEKKPTSD